MLITIAIIAPIMLLLYTAYLFIIRFYWGKAISTETLSTKPKTTISVIIPFRNEAQNLPVLVACFEKQTYPKSLVSFVFVNDHSEDKSIEVLQNLIAEKSEFQLVNLSEESGKKSAIKKGIASSESELIITVDADVIIGEKWLTQIAAHYEKEKNDLTILPVMISPANSFFQKLQQLDFLNLAGLTGASAMMKSPLMCNGANLCYTRNTYNELADKIGHWEIASGDDMFLLLAMKKNNKRIGYYFHRDVVAETSPSPTLKGFLSQRVRWASKTRLMKDRHIFLSGLLITMANLSVVLFAILFALGKTQLNLFLSFMMMKTIVDMIFLNAIAVAFGVRIPVVMSVLLSVIYPVYVLIMPILILFYPAKWKGRVIIMNYEL